MTPQAAERERDGADALARLDLETPMPRIAVRGKRLYAGRVPWRAWGMNWGIGDHAPVLAYFDNPVKSRFEVLASELRTARALGANSMRIYLELGQVMKSSAQARPRTLAALRRLLALAELEQIYLDITGNLVWRPSRAPAWYDQLRQPARWRVQERFWRSVAGAAAESPAVLCYELTSEPVVGKRRGYYLGALDGWTFIQSIAVRRGRDARGLARSWTNLLADAVRSQDDRPVTIGLLPDLDHAFAPGNVADLLDLLVVHQYPQRGQVSQAIATVRAFAAFNKPVLLGETFLLLSDAPSQRRFLLGANRHVVGTFEFFDGRAPEEVDATTLADVMYQTGLRQFVDLRGQLLKLRSTTTRTAGS
jgi:hypothetical protein